MTESDIAQPKPLKTNAGASTKRSVYINTIVFSIISAFVSIALLSMVIFLPAARVFVYAIITLELGLIAIIIAAVVRIVLYEKKLKKQADQGNAFLVNIDTCPDYFSSSFYNSSSLTAVDNMVVFQSAQGNKLVCTDKGPTGVFCDHSDLQDINETEKFVVIKHSNGTNGSVISLKRFGTNYYCTLKDDGSLDCSSVETMGDKEKFILKTVNSAESTVTLTSSTNTSQVCYVDDSTKQVKCSTSVPITDSTRTNFLWKERNPTTDELKFGEGIICSNGYRDPTRNVTYYFVRRGCTYSDSNDSGCRLGSNNRPAKEYKVMLNDYSNRAVAEVCKDVNGQADDNAFRNIPWTDVKTRCSNMHLP
jgi:hypothetical protein